MLQAAVRSAIDKTMQEKKKRSWARWKRFMAFTLQKAEESVYRIDWNQTLQLFK